MTEKEFLELRDKYMADRNEPSEYEEAVLKYEAELVEKYPFLNFFDESIEEGSSTFVITSTLSIIGFVPFS